MMESLHVAYEKGKDNDLNNFMIVLKTNLTGSPAATIKRHGPAATELMDVLLGHGKHKILEVVDTFEDYNYDGIVFDIRDYDLDTRKALVEQLTMNRISHTNEIQPDTAYFYIENEDVEAWNKFEELYNYDTAWAPEGNYLVVKLIFDGKDFCFCRGDGELVLREHGVFNNEG